MSKAKQMMVYSAITEEQSMRQFEADAARLEREGYVPVAQSWDHTTLTVTYALREGPLPETNSVDVEGALPRPRSGLARWLRLSFGS